MFMLKNSIYIILFHFFTNFTLSQSQSFNYKGTIGSVPTEMTMVVSVSKDGCIFTFDGTYFNKRLKKELEIKTTLNPCKNEKENPDEKITLLEYNNDTISGSFQLKGIGEYNCSGNWISKNGKRKTPARFTLKKEN